MDNDNRMKNARELVTKITEVATELSPETYGAHLRFINKDDSTANNLNAKQVDQRLQFTPAGSTELGTNLEKKVLQPLVYDVINQGVLHRPLVILTITDGIPTDGQDTFAQVLKRCIKTLEGKGYDKRAVYFDLSQVGNDQEAIAFIESLESETATRGPLHDTLHRTALSI
ncbi:hypothetical protein BJY04DRAFT_154082 [Aspergillus karnatakaensis]|uniref:uncharacterized protein n=1 Tax=Aspergillus karnatakaensis TaxID=1810916 RepID=UPI003CCCF94D